MARVSPKIMLEDEINFNFAKQKCYDFRIMSLFFFFFFLFFGGGGGVQPDKMKHWGITGSPSDISKGTLQNLIL